MRIVHPFPQSQRARIDVKFLDPNYPRWRTNAGLQPAEHPGVDLNLAGTRGDGDLGYPVVSIADGEVIAAEFYPVWGNIVLIEHPLLAKALNLPYLASMYAHLHQISVEKGQEVRAGDPVGSIGKGDGGRFQAHLHFEIRRAKLAPDFWPGLNRALIDRNYIDPVKFLHNHMNYNQVFTVEKVITEGTPGDGLAKVSFDDPKTLRIKWMGVKR